MPRAWADRDVLPNGLAHRAVNRIDCAVIQVPPYFVPLIGDREQASWCRSCRTRVAISLARRTKPVARATLAHFRGGEPVRMVPIKVRIAKRRGRPLETFGDVSGVKGRESRDSRRLHRKKWPLAAVCKWPFSIGIPDLPAPECRKRSTLRAGRVRFLGVEQPVLV